MPDDLEIYIHELPLLWKSIILALGLGSLVAIVLVFGFLKLSSPWLIAQVFIVFIVFSVAVLLVLSAWIDQKHRDHTLSRPLNRFAKQHGFSLFRHPEEETDFLVSGSIRDFSFELRKGVSSDFFHMRIEGHLQAHGVTILYPGEKIEKQGKRVFGLEGVLVHPLHAPAGFEIRATSEKAAHQALDERSSAAIRQIEGLTGIRIAPDGIECVLELAHPATAERLEKALGAGLEIARALSIKD